MVLLIYLALAHNVMAQDPPGSCEVRDVSSLSESGKVFPTRLCKFCYSASTVLYYYHRRTDVRRRHKRKTEEDPVSHLMAA